MASEDLTIRLGLKGQQQVAKGLRDVKADAKGVGDAAESAGAKAQLMGAKFSRASDKAGMGLGKLVGALGLVSGAYGLGRLTIAGTKWGLSFNSQVEQARLRFQLFTTDIDGLTNSVKAIDQASMFNFGDLADAAALLGGSGIKDVPKTLQAAANAAAGGGKGTEGLKSIVLALSQIQSKGRLSQEEINQLTEGGAITAQRDLTKGLHLTAKELQNVGGQGIEAKKALDVLTKAWTSGQMADAAKRQLNSLAGQWGLFTGNAQKIAGVMTLGLASSLSKDVLPAANRAAEAIDKIFGKEGLSNEEKLRQARAVIKRELGPIGEDLKGEIDKAHIPEHLGDVVGAAIPYMAGAAAKAAPHAAAAFVTAWIHSGPWAQLATLLFVAKKANDIKTSRAEKAQRALGALGGRGQTALNPLYVWVVGEGVASVIDPGGPGGKKSPGRVKTAGRTAYDKGGKYILPIAALVAAEEGGRALGHGVDLHDSAYAITHALLSPLGNLIPGNRPRPEDPISRSLRTGEITRIENNVTVTLDGRVVGQGTDRAKAKQKARK